MTPYITQPGLYRIPEAEYHADPCRVPSLSSGIASLIVNRTMAEARFAHPRLNPDYEPEDSTAFDLGSVAHTMLLGRGAEIQIIDAEDWRTKAAKEARAEALEAGKQPVLKKVFEQGQAMVAAALEQIADDADNRDAFDLSRGVSEQVVVAQHSTNFGPIWLRTMMDRWINTAETGGQFRIYDYKTFKPGADPDGFAKYLFREARDVQDPLYRINIAKALFLHPGDVSFRYVVQSPEPPFCLSVIELDEQASAFALERARWAMDQWGKAMHSGEWPGYRSRTHYAAAPAYAMAAWADKMLLEEQADALNARAEEMAA